jgi:hypothetical protein
LTYVLARTEYENTSENILQHLHGVTSHLRLNKY